MWLSMNYDLISFWAKRWSKNEWGELISLMSIYLDKNWSQFSHLPENDKIRFLQTWMKNNVRWTKSEFSNNIRVNNLGDEQSFVGDIYTPLIEIGAEDAPEELKEYIIEITEKWGELRADKILLVKSIYRTLPTESKVLYDLYITKGMSLRSIADLLNIPMSSVYSMIKVLKKDILLRCGM